MIKLKVSLLFLLSCGHLNVTASAQASQEKPVVTAKDTATSITQVTPAASAVTNPEATTAVPYSEIRYNMWTAAGKTNTTYLEECNADDSLNATLQAEPVRAKTLYNRSLAERFQKDLSDKRNQNRLQTIIKIGKKHSENLKNAERQNKLGLDQDVARVFRLQQESALLTLLTEQKLLLCTLRNERTAAEELAKKNYDDALDQMRERASVVSYNYCYLRNKSNYAEEDSTGKLDNNAGKKEPYVDITAFAKLLDAMPAQKAATSEDTGGK